MPELPAQVEAFHDAVHRLVAVQEVATRIDDLSHLTPDSYSLPGAFGDLPHALLRRTGGALANEAWENTEFTLSRDEAGWLTLEFLAWWVRDHSRSGDQIQLRPMGLPPKGFEVQLGHNLKFIIDQFVLCSGESTSAALEMLQEKAESLNSNIDDYASILGDLVRPCESL